STFERAGVERLPSQHPLHTVLVAVTPCTCLIYPIYDEEFFLEWSKWRQDALELEVAPSVIRRPMFSNRPIRGEHYDEAFRISRSRIPRDGLRECRPWSAHCFQKWQT